MKSGGTLGQDNISQQKNSQTPFTNSEAAKNKNINVGACPSQFDNINIPYTLYYFSYRLYCLFLFF